MRITLRTDRHISFADFEGSVSYATPQSKLKMLKVENALAAEEVMIDTTACFRSIVYLTEQNEDEGMGDSPSREVPYSLLVCCTRIL